MARRGRVIKRIRFATARRPPGEFVTAWPDAVAAALRAPAGARPLRVAACTVLPDLTPDPRHDGIGLEWFSGAGHLAAFERWLATGEGRAAARRLDAVVDPVASPVVVADERVVRGAEWLARRWRAGGARLKHVAVARRATGLAREQFSERWRSRAGRVGALVVPAEARGCAYVQNHAIASGGTEPSYDAVNEVYVEDLDGLTARIRWLAAALAGGGEADLVRDPWLLAVREVVAEPPAG